MKDINEILAVIDNTYLSLYKLRTDKKSWVDEANKKPGLMMTCEGLESILIPNLDEKARLLGNKANVLKFFKAMILEDVNNIITLSDKEKEGGFYSTPYSCDDDGIADVLDGDDQETVDSACFVVSSLLHFTILFKNHFVNDEELFNKVFNTIDNGLQFLIKTCKDNGGWSWGVNKSNETNLYFTWSAIETLIDVIEYCPDYKEIQTIREKITLTMDWINATFLLEISKGNWLQFLPKRSGTGTDLHYYYNLYAIICYISGKPTFNKNDKNKISTGLLKIIEYYRENHVSFDRDFRIPIDGLESVRVEYIDKCFIPLLIKAAILFIDKYPTLTNSKKIQKHLPFMFEQLIKYRSKGDSEGEYDGMWNKHNYSIYYTERVMECLNRVCLYFLKKEPSTPTTVHTSDVISISKDSLLPYFLELLKSDESQNLIQSMGKGKVEKVISGIDPNDPAIASVEASMDLAHKDIATNKNDLEKLGTLVDRNRAKIDALLKLQDKDLEDD